VVINLADFILLMLAAFSAFLNRQEGAERGTSRRMQCSMTERKNFQAHHYGKIQQLNSLLLLRACK
jgi:hypothetical protein